MSYFAVLFVKGESESQNPLKRSDPLMADSDDQARALAMKWLATNNPLHYRAFKMILRQDEREVQSWPINDLGQ
jgi:hypothetical protein